MARKADQSPLVSVTLPLAPDADPELLNICVRSLADQTYRHFEVLILISDGSRAELTQIAESMPSARVFEGSFSKSGARNFLASKAIGEYMIYLGVHSELSSGLLEELVSIVLEKDLLAAICPQRGASGTSFWSKCRSLEKELMLGDPMAEGPCFIKLSTFREIGGFDEDLDPLDDWALTSKLRERGVLFARVRSPITIRQTTSLAEMLRRKYLRGQKIPSLIQKYPDIEHLRLSKRFLDEYLRNWKLLARSPILSIGLAFLKMLDISALSFGRFRHIAAHDADGARAYLRPEVASTYDQVRLQDNFQRYKHFAEVSSLLTLIEHLDGTLLEVGCGTGRITSELESRGFKILPTDPSPAMLERFTAKTLQQESVMADGRALPFKEGKFEGTYSMRVVWHLPTKSSVYAMITEMKRVSSQFLVFDIANKRRWRHPFVKPLAALYFFLNPFEHKAHSTSQFISVDEVASIAEKLGLEVFQVLPLDVWSPVWLRILPSTVARSLYPLLFRLDSIGSRLIPPGRFLMMLTKS